MTISLKLKDLFKSELLNRYLEGEEPAAEMTWEDFCVSVEARWEEICNDKGYSLEDAIADVLRDPVYRLYSPKQIPNSD